MWSWNSPLGWVLLSTWHEIIDGVGSRIEYDLSPDCLTKFRILCPTDSDVYRLIGLDYMTDISKINVINITTRQNNLFRVEISAKFNNWLSVYRIIDVNEKELCHWNISKEKWDKGHYEWLTIAQLKNMKDIWIRKSTINAFKIDYWSKYFYGYNIWPKYWYDVYWLWRDEMIKELNQLLMESNLSFDWKYTDEEVKQELEKFLILYEWENPPDLLMPLLFENPILRNMRRKIGRSFDAQMVLEDGHPTWEYFKKNFLRKKDNI